MLSGTELILEERNQGHKKHSKISNETNMRNSNIICLITFTTTNLII